MFMPQSSSFEFQQHNHLQVKHEPPRVFDLFFLLRAPDSYSRLEAISPPASNCLSAHLTADWSDAACCQSLRQSLRCHITCFFFFFFSHSCFGLTWCSTRASLQRSASFAHLQRMRPLRKMGPPWITGPYAQRVFGM